MIKPDSARPRLESRVALAGAAMCIAVAAGAQNVGLPARALDDDRYTFETAEIDRINVDVVVRGLNHPFSLAFLPNGDALVVERGQALRFIADATGTAALAPQPVTGTPPPGDMRGTGLHDIAIAPDFAGTRRVWFTHNVAGEPDPDADPPNRRPTAVTLSRARFVDGAVVDMETVYSGEMQLGASGSRIAFGTDGMLYMTTGAPFTDAAQDPGSAYGKVLRLHPDGRVPADNPFAAAENGRGEVYSLGHRDQLGLTVHPDTGQVFAAEHGPNGGDEVNLILPGRNYGWPDYSFGRSYEGPRISELPVVAGIEQPLVLWLPSIAPTGLTFYSGRGMPAWTGNLFVGSARAGQIPGTGGLQRVVLNEQLEELRRESLLTGLRQRVRDVREGPDGLLYVITDEDDGALLRISPADR